MQENAPAAASNSEIPCLQLPFLLSEISSIENFDGKIWLRSAGDGFDCAYFWGVWMFLTFGRKLRLEMGIDGGTLGCLQFFFTSLPANMVYVTSWDDFVEKSIQLFRTDPESIIPSYTRSSFSLLLA
ncbi:hypothetical protein RHGRI_014292 [Rhododendron griersonianum]|uniref:Uncharacterized protein n=1 Tax=Rhododendron griersonianum TaxID=479676 RepID=A0AAV6K8S5_9ERIC|nr:hypothetical protein RHGRI_014292 [Rhododendron griersonianum]